VTWKLRPALGAGAPALAIAQVAIAQTPGGILQMPNFSSPASMSIHEESTIAVGIPMMGVFNNLVVFDQHVAQNSLASVVPDLATGWAWNEDGTQLTFPLRQGVKWHDGKLFTPRDVKCTWDTLLERSADKFRINPRKSWYRNVEEITTSGDHEVTFHLKRPQPYLVTLLASGQSPVYPCHVTPAQMRQRPIGTGPFKFVEFKPNERIKVVKNPDYWKPGRPYLDAIETTIIPNTGTRQLAFAAGQFDMLWMSMPLWDIERRLAEDASRPVLLYARFATCRQPRVKGLVTMTNSRFNGWRMEDAWLDK
jgi:peptide/nickel transport system substrate-binding protein